MKSDAASAGTARDPETREDEVRLCRLQYAAGRIEACSAACPFWEEGGAVLAGGCALERLGLDLPGNPELVDALVKIRWRLAQAGTREKHDEARSLFYRLVPAASRGDEDDCDAC